MASTGLRTLCLAYTDFPRSDPFRPADFFAQPHEENLTVLCIVGIKASWRLQEQSAACRVGYFGLAHRPRNAKGGCSQPLSNVSTSDLGTPPKIQHLNLCFSNPVLDECRTRCAGRCPTRWPPASGRASLCAWSPATTSTPPSTLPASAASSQVSAMLVCHVRVSALLVLVMPLVHLLVVKGLTREPLSGPRVMLKGNAPPHLAAPPLADEGAALEGPVFRNMPEEELLPLLPKLQVRPGHSRRGAEAESALHRRQSSLTAV